MDIIIVAADIITVVRTKRNRKDMNGAGKHNIISGLSLVYNSLSIASVCEATKTKQWSSFGVTHGRRQGRPWPARAVRLHRAPKIIGPLNILDIYMYINNKIYWFVTSIGKNDVKHEQSTKESQPFTHVHACTEMNG
jgi:hypothetical protein